MRKKDYADLVEQIKNEFLDEGLERQEKKIEIVLLEESLNLYNKQKRFVRLVRIFSFITLPLGCYLIVRYDSIFIKILWGSNLINNFFSLIRVNKIEQKNEEMMESVFNELQLIIDIYRKG